MNLGVFGNAMFFQFGLNRHPKLFRLAVNTTGTIT
jgi:hypothetical protein